VSGAWTSCQSPTTASSAYHPIAVRVGLAVAVRDDDVADREPRHLGADADDLSEGGVAGVDLAAAHLRDVHRVGESRVVHVVLAGDGQDAQVHVARSDGTQLDRVEGDDARDVDFVEVASDTLALGGDGFGGDRVGSGHRNPRGGGLGGTGELGLREAGLG
jgi:hypothetical protein